MVGISLRTGTAQSLIEDVLERRIEDALVSDGPESHQSVEREDHSGGASDRCSPVGPAPARYRRMELGILEGILSCARWHCHHHASPLLACRL